MKIILLLAGILLSVNCFSQDVITLKNKKELNVNITRITTDSIFWNEKKIEKGQAINEIKKFHSYDDFKSYLINNGDTATRGSYAQRCINDFRSARAGGKTVMALGSGVTIYSLATLMKLNNPKEGEEIDPEKVKNAQVIGIVGSALTVLGILIDASAGSSLKNIYSAPEYEVGIGYRFKF